MKRNVFITLAVLLLSGFCVNAQKVVLKSGAFDFIKDQKAILVKYDYSNMGVGKFDKEEEYVASKVADYNKDEAGKGDTWKTSWYNDRSKRYEPKYELLFNEYMAEKSIKCDKAATDAKYEMLVHTSFVEPGFNVGVMRKDAFINAEITFKEIGSGKEMAVITVLNCPGRGGMGYDFDTGYRIEEAYAKLGKSISGFILKKIK